MGSCCGITGGGPPKPQSSSYPNRAAKPATANVPSTPAAPAATSRIAEVPSGVTTPASSPKLSVRSPAGVGQLRVSIVPFGSMIAVLTSPFPLGGAQHRWLRPSAVGGLLRFSAWTGLAGNQRDACLRTVAVHPWLCKCGAPDRSGRARCGLLWPEHSSKSNAWPEQSGPLRRAQQLRVGRTARFVRHNRGAP